jgi:hypothetical protein
MNRLSPKCASSQVISTGNTPENIIGADPKDSQSSPKKKKTTLKMSKKDEGWG